MKKLRIVVGGFIGLLPAGGVTWDYVQYPLGLQLMGHDVYYLEDTRLYPVYQTAGKAWDDASDSIRHLQSVMQYFDMADRWAYRDEASGKSYGLTEAQIKDICRTADVFLNVSCSTVIREEYRNIPCRILLDSDPMFTQIQYETEQTFTPGAAGLQQLVAAHNYFFSFGENIGQEDCLIPIGRIDWKTTRQPICLQYWDLQRTTEVAPKRITTLMNWSAGKVLDYQGSTWGQKDVEFAKILEIPPQFPDYSFGIVVNQTGGKSSTFPEAALSDQGWQVLDPKREAGNWITYQQFLHGSFAELSVAKETYVKGRTGWFSCRSACYLACGVPVVCQDTGWSRNLPTGNGLFAFSDKEEATAALQRIIAEPEQQARGARAVAEDYFDHSLVLQDLLDQL